MSLMEIAHYKSYLGVSEEQAEAIRGCWLQGVFAPLRLQHIRFIVSVKSLQRHRKERREG